MPTNYIVLAIPGFFALIALEVAYVRAKKLSYYRVADSINNMATGVIDQLLGAIATTLVTFSLYEFVYSRFAVIRLDSSNVWTWVLGFIGSDFLYYWWHRKSHELSFLWATHVVHHQSQEYNLTVALRQTWFAQLTSIFFYLPLALVGVSTEVFLATKSFMILYQFWIHTRVLGKLGWAELVFNTPSHHRVHHGINPKYIDKNYAGAFIVWDKLFGTFAEEKEEPRYGTLKPLKSWNPIWANFHSIWETYVAAKSFRNFRDRLLVWWKHPGWTPARGGGVDLEGLYREASRSRFGPPLSTAKAVYVLIQFGVLLGTSSYILFNMQALAPIDLLSAFGLVLAGLYSLGALCERRQFAPAIELIRVSATLLWIFAVVVPAHFH